MLHALERLTLDGNGMMHELPDSGRILTHLTSLQALSMDNLAFSSIDTSTEKWCRNYVKDLSITKSHMPKSKMKEHLFGDAAKPNKAENIIKLG